MRATMHPYRRQILQRITNDRNGNLEFVRQLDRPGQRWIEEQREMLNVRGKNRRRMVLELTFAIRRVEATLPQEILATGAELLVQSGTVPNEAVEVIARLRNRWKIQHTVMIWHAKVKRAGLGEFLLPPRDYARLCAAEDMQIYRSMGLIAFFRIEIASYRLLPRRLRNSDYARMRELRRKTRNLDSEGRRCVVQ
uniref:VP6a n=1 Tax=Kemerovo virus TaxID=40064 RepID=A0A5S9H6V3_9REOV|nr:VP6a [Kemerovo virus]